MPEAPLSLIATLLRSGKSQRQIARLTGIPITTLRRRIQRYGLDQPVSPTFLAALSKPRTVDELARQLRWSESATKTEIIRLQAFGYPIVQQGEKWVLMPQVSPGEAPVPLPPPQDGRILIGVVSDTHLGSKHQQLTYLRETYRRFADAGVQQVLHCGDLLDGIDVYRGQHAHQFLHTYDEQIDYAVEHYPKDVPTAVIGGNHDLAGVKRGDSDPLRRLAAQRSDITYLGPYSAWPQYGQLLWYLLHPEGRPAYAASYKMQKIIESFEGGKKPNVLIVGHWHQMLYLHTRNVHGFHPGCFQSQTEHDRRHALQPQIGAMLLEIFVSPDGAMHEIKPTFFRYFVPKENDYK